jgi:choline dehydrogenase-like flavoprotein
MEIPFAALAALEGVEFCIIGAGPAGITCARRLAAKGRKVLLLEAGGWEWSEQSQASYAGETIGDKYFDLDASRLRYFGGTSNHWTGWCRPLDAHEFAGKGFDNIGRWPIRRSDLDPYLPGAMEILEIDLPEPDVPLKGGMLRKIDVSFSPPVRFAAKYRDEILASDRILLCLDCNLTRMDVADGLAGIGRLGLLGPLPAARLQQQHLAPLRRQPARAGDAGGTGADDAELDALERGERREWNLHLEILGADHPARHRHDLRRRRGGRQSECPQKQKKRSAPKPQHRGPQVSLPSGARLRQRYGGNQGKPL